jgi:hypothetical protein
MFLRNVGWHSTDYRRYTPEDGTLHNFTSWATVSCSRRTLVHGFGYVCVLLGISYGKRINIICKRCIFVYDLLSDAASISDYIASNGGLINEYWIGKDAEEIGFHLMTGTRPPFVWMDWETMKNISQNSRCPRPHSNRAPPGYTPEPLPLEPIFSVEAMEIGIVVWQWT